MSSTNCWLVWNCLRFCTFPLHFVWAALHNTFHAFHIHVKLRWSLTLHCSYPITTLDCLWDRKSISLSCWETKSLGSLRAQLLFLKYFPLHVPGWSVLLLSLWQIFRLQASATSQMWVFVHLLCPARPTEASGDLLSLHSWLLIGTAPFQRLLSFGECPSMAFSCERWLTHTAVAQLL